MSKLDAISREYKLASHTCDELLRDAELRLVELGIYVRASVHLGDRFSLCWCETSTGWQLCFSCPDADDFTPWHGASLRLRALGVHKIGELFEDLEKGAVCCMNDISPLPPLPLL